VFFIERVSKKDIYGYLPIFIVLIAVLVRFVALAIVPTVSQPDALTYFQAGSDLFGSGSMSSDIVMPIYPIWSYIFGGEEYLQYADILVSSATVYLIYLLSVEIFKKEWVGYIAASIAAFYPFFVFYSLVKVTETLYIFVLCLGVLFLYRKAYFWGSVALVISILIRPTLDLLAPIMIFVFAFFVHRLSWKISLFKVLVYGLVYFCLMSPWWAHNYQKYDQFVRLNLGTGLVVYYGNCCAVTKDGAVDLTADFNCLATFGSIEDPILRNKEMVHEGVRCIQENPERAVKLFISKILEFWRVAPHSHSLLKYYSGLFSYGLVFLLSVIFIIRKGREYFIVLLPVFLLIGYLTLVHACTFAYVRYRLPLEVFLIILASYMLVSVFDKWSLLMQKLEE